MEKIICFRFDVDTYPCAAKGVPNLVELARKYDSKFTFYFNMGRAIHIPTLLFAKKPTSLPERAAKLSNMQKLGPIGYVRTALLNPRVGSSFPANIVEAFKRNPPDYVLFMHKDTRLYGYPHFGKDYGRLIYQWVASNYKAVQRIGAIPFKDKGQFGIVVFERTSAANRKSVTDLRDARQ